MINILRKINGVETVVAVVSNKNTSHKQVIMGADEVTIGVIVSQVLDVKDGDYMYHNEIVYTCNRDAEYTKYSNVNYQYTLLFEHPLYRLLDKLLTYPLTGSAVFTLTGKLVDFVDACCWNMNYHATNNPRGIDSGWTRGSVVDTDYLTLTFNSVSCRDAITQIATAFNAEFYFSADGKTINFVDHIENQTGLVFVQGRGNGLYSVSQQNVDSKDTITRVYPVGGNQNVPVAYADQDGNLKLPELYLENTSEYSRIVEKRVVFEDVFPHFVGDVESVAGTNNVELVCSDIDFDLNQIAVGDNARINFLTGALMGISFQFQYNHDLKKVTLIPQNDDTALVNDDGTVPQVPRSTRKAAVTDKFNFTGVVMPVAYVNSAITKLREKGTSWLSFYSRKRVKFGLDIDYRWMRGKQRLNPGDLVTVQIPERGIDKQIRISELTTNLYSGQLNATVSNYRDENWQKKVEGAISSLQTTVSGGGVGGGVDILERYDARPSSDRNVMSSLRSEKNFLRKDMADTAAERITFDKGAVVRDLATKDFVQDKFAGAGAGIYEDEQGNSVMEVDKLNVRKEAWFNEIVINQIRFQGGIVVYSAATLEVLSVVDGGSYLQVSFDTKDGQLANQFAVDDQIRCQRFSGGNVIKYYMSRVTSVGTDYIRLSKSDIDGTLNVEVGDALVQFGNRTNTARQSLIEVNVLDGGKQTFYQGVNSYSLNDKNYLELGRMLVDGQWKNMIRSYGGAYLGNRDTSSYIQYNETTGKVEIKADVQFRAADNSYKSVESGIQEVGRGSNIFPQAEFQTGLTGYTFGGLTLPLNGVNLNSTWSLGKNTNINNTQGLNTIWLYHSYWSNDHPYSDVESGNINAIVGGKRYCVSVYSGAHTCKVGIYLFFYNTAGDWVGYAGDSAYSSNNSEALGGSLLSDYKRIYAFATAPANAVSATVVFRKYDTKLSEPESESSYAFFCRPMVEEVDVLTIKPGIWKPYASSGEITAVKDTANAAQEAADDAASDAAFAITEANAANTAITAISSDNVLSANEKGGELGRWNTIVAEKDSILNQAIAFGMTNGIGSTRLAFSTMFQNLANYLNAGITWTTGTPSWLSNLTTNTTIVGATYRSKWEAYYTARTNILNEIAVKAKDIAISTAATDATNKVAVVQAQLNDIASDGKLTPNEKQQVKREYDALVKQVQSIDSQCAILGLDDVQQNSTYADFIGYYFTLDAYINPLLDDVTSTSNINSNDFNTTFQNCYAGVEAQIAQITGVLNTQSKSADYIKAAIKGTTEVQGGLVTTNILGVKDSNDVTTAGMNGINGPGNDIRFWAGETIENMENAPFRVYEDGKVALGRESDGKAIEISMENIPTLTEIEAREVYDIEFPSGSVFTVSKNYDNPADSPHTPDVNVEAYFMLKYDGIYTIDLVATCDIVSLGPYTIVIDELYTRVRRMSDNAIIETGTITNGTSPDSESAIYFVDQPLTKGLYKLEARAKCHGTINAGGSVIIANVYFGVISYKHIIKKLSIGLDGIALLDSMTENFFRMSLADPDFLIRATGGLKWNGNTDMPGVLATGNIGSAGNHSNPWGSKTNTGNATYTATGIYDVPHLIGSTAYSVSVSPIGDGLHAFVISKSNNSFRVQIRNNSGVASVGAFGYIITGNN